MFLFLLSIANAVNYYRTTTGDILGQTNENGRDVCISVNAPASCYSIDSSSIMTGAGFSTGTCTSEYSVSCSDNGFTAPIIGCGDMSFSMYAKTNVDCDLFGTPTTSTTRYRFMSDSTWGQSTGIDVDFCTNALLPDSCAGQDKTTNNTETLGAVVGECADVYATTCDGVANSNVINGIGICGSATIDVLFRSQADCDSATDNAAGASAAAATAAEAANGCVEADSFADTPLTCQQAADTLGCSQAAVMMACRATCNVGDCGSASALTIALAALSAIIFAF
jgi:hypothetical protein